jgi:hypothetical protein
MYIYCSAPCRLLAQNRLSLNKIYLPGKNGNSHSILSDWYEMLLLVNFTYIFQLLERSCMSSITCDVFMHLMGECHPKTVHVSFRCYVSPLWSGMIKARISCLLEWPEQRRGGGRCSLRGREVGLAWSNKNLSKVTSFFLNKSWMFSSGWMRILPRN